MNLIIANDQATLTSMGAANQTLMFPSHMVLAIDTSADTSLKVHVRSPKDTDDTDVLKIIHVDTNTEEKAFRNMVDNVVSMLNGQYKGKPAVMFDLLNNVGLPGQTLTGSTVTQN